MSALEDTERLWLLGLQRWSGPEEKGYCSVSKCGFLLVLHSLPWSTDISESKGPGTVLQTFFFNCSSYMPTLELLSVRPPTSFFNKPSLHGHKGLYLGKVRPQI